MVAAWVVAQPVVMREERASHPLSHRHQRCSCAAAAVAAAADDDGDDEKPVACFGWT
jgi:hypothetical protein